MSNRLEWLEDNSLYFDCPGCGMMHAVPVNKTKSPCWSWNNDMVNPTFSPSLLVRWTVGDKQIPKVCHSFVKNGNIEFLTDCTHEHAGKTLPLPTVIK